MAPANESRLIQPNLVLHILHFQNSGNSNLKIEIPHKNPVQLCW